MARTDRRARGAVFEAAARAHLEAQGLRLLQANANFRVGELDLVMAHAEAIVFVEVRYRASNAFGDGADSVDWRKMRKLARAAQAWLLRNPALAEKPCRFDVVSVSGTELTPEIEWIPDAFRLDDL